MSDGLSADKQALLQARLGRKTAARKPATIPARSAAVVAGQAITAPLSFAQQRMWLLHELESASSAYTICNATRYLGALDVDALCQAFTGLCERHAILRTRFELADDEPRQFVLPEARPAIRRVDASGLEPARRADEVEAILDAEVRTRFDLAAAPPLRVVLITCGPSEHVLVVTLHHILFDAWSDSILMRDLNVLYESCRSGRPARLDPLPIQYADFAQWQRGIRDSAEMARLEQYWRRRLDGAPPLLALPCDRPRPKVPTHAGAALDFALSPDVSAGLADLCRQTQTTLFMVLTAAMSVLLARHASQREVCLGTPVANRSRPELEPLIGLFLNTLVIRTRVDGDESFADLLARVRSDVLDDFAHAEMPFERLIDIDRGARTTEHSPLFQALLVVQNAPAGRPEAAGITIEKVPRPVVHSKFDLSLYVVEHPGRIDASFEYSTELFDERTIARLSRHLAALLAGVVADRTRSVGDIDIMGPDERALLAQFNATEQRYDGQRFIHAYVEQQAAMRPDAIAIRFDGQALDYADLNRRANGLAHELIGMGVRPDDRVAICAERSIEMVVGLLGVLKAGGAYVPLDPQIPHRRLDAMLQDCMPRALLIQRHLAGRLPATEVPVLSLDVARDTRADDPVPSELGLLPSHLAYVMYTSGSTGTPKGVMIQHDAAVNRLRWACDAFALDERDRIFQKTPYAFDVSVWEFFLPAMAGATLVLARPGGHQDPAYLAETMRAEQVTVVHFVPSMLQVFIEQAPAWACESVRHVLCSGEALSRSLHDQFMAWQPGVALHNLYGPTEAAIDVTHWRCDPGCPPGAVPIGRAIANTQLHVLDETGRQVPPGIVGELAIGGVQVARGYLNRPELSAERFVPDRFGCDPARKLYRTGDLVRYRNDGALEYFGRNDFQVKLRGLRIELGEIEATLGLEPDVREAVVLARSVGAGEPTLVAYVAGDPKKIHAAALRRSLAQRLPDYMVPTRVVVLERMPVTANGKLDRASLEQMELRQEPTLQNIAPVGTLEAEVCAMCAEVLGREVVGLDEGFLELGGHSLAAVRLRHAINRRHGTAISMRDVFEAGSLADLAREVARQRTVALSGLEEAPACSTAGAIPASRKQLADWVANRVSIATGQQSLCVQRELALHAIDVAAVRQALAFMVRRYEILRTVLKLEGGQLVQEILPDIEEAALLEEIDLRENVDPEAELDRLRHAEATQTFDFSRWPLFSAVLAHVPRRDVFLFTIDHVCMDQQFFAVLIEEFTAAYLAFTEGRAPDLPPVTSTYQAYAKFESAELSGAAGAAHRRYWQALMRDVPVGQDASFSDRAPRAMSTDYGTSLARQIASVGERLDPNVAALAHGAVLNVAPERVRSAGYIFGVDREVFARLKATASDHGIALSTVMVTAVLLLTSRLTGAERAALVMLADTRSQGEWLTVGGCFINEMLVCAPVRESDTGLSLLKRVQRQLLDSDAHKIFPFARVLADSNLSVEQLGTPFLNYISSQSEDELPLFDPYHVGESFTGMAISINVSAFRNSFRIACHYETRRFEPGSIVSIMTRFEQVLDWLASRAHEPLATAPTREDLPVASTVSPTL